MNATGTPLVDEAPADLAKYVECGHELAADRDPAVVAAGRRGCGGACAFLRRRARELHATLRVGHVALAVERYRDARDRRHGAGRARAPRGGRQRERDQRGASQRPRGADGSARALRRLARERERRTQNACERDRAAVGPDETRVCTVATCSGRPVRRDQLRGASAFDFGAPPRAPELVSPSRTPEQVATVHTRVVFWAYGGAVALAGVLIASAFALTRRGLRRSARVTP